MPGLLQSFLKGSLAALGAQEVEMLQNYILKYSDRQQLKSVFVLLVLCGSITVPIFRSLSICLIHHSLLRNLKLLV